MVLMSVAGVRVYDSATASRLDASAGVPTQLGFDAPASDNIQDADGPRQRRTEPEQEPEQLPLPSEDESPGYASGDGVRDTEESQVLTGATICCQWHGAWNSRSQTQWGWCQRMRMRSYCRMIALTMRGLDTVVIVLRTGLG